mgnify:CR=1 FL=1
MKRLFYFKKMINIDSLTSDLDLVRQQSPLIHNITNYVVMNNTANALLAIGASPVMIHAMDEVAEMAAIASALVLNIGTIESSWLDAMLIAGKSAHSNGKPIVFDPVGAGATAYRIKASKQIIEECKPSIIRGNASEIMALCNSNIKTKGVDSTTSSDLALSSAKELAKASGAIVVISGETDYITDGLVVEYVKNGTPMMERVTGLGCTATAIVAAFAAINPNMLAAATHAMAVMGICGEIAEKKSRGSGSLQVNFLDELYLLDEETIKKTIKL